MNIRVLRMVVGAGYLAAAIPVEAHTWALICSRDLKPDAHLPPGAPPCDLYSADRWFEVAPSAAGHIDKSIERLGIFDPKRQYLEVFSASGSLGTDSYIFYPCDTPRSQMNDSLAATPEYETDLHKELNKGECLW